MLIDNNKKHAYEYAEEPRKSPDEKYIVTHMHDKDCAYIIGFL